MAIMQTGSADNVSSGIYMPRPLLGITGVGVKEKTYYKNVTTNGQSGIEEVEDGYAATHPKTTFYAAVTGVYVSAISDGSDAANYLKVGDIITEVNGKPVAIIYDVMDVVNAFNGGDQVEITYYRDGEYKTARVTLKTSREMGAK
jgi:S1-C subfamily serine protease